MIETTEVDGVPTLFVRQRGQMVTGLTFRVGMVDETLATKGITHLVEHLALHRLGLGDYHHNGMTGMTHTSFFLRGSQEDAVGYLMAVCTALGRLPVERLEMEKQILRTEEAGRPRSASAELQLWRYGAQGYGLAAYPEWGLYQLRPEDVLRWANTWFVRENAVLWIAGDRMPEGLRLPLQQGQRRPPPTAMPVLPATPAYFSAGTGAVLFDGLVRPDDAASVTAGLLERQLFHDLRQRDGNSYSATASYQRRGPSGASITAFADALPNKQDAVLGGFLDVLARLEAGRIDEAELQAVRRKATEDLNAEDADATRLPSYAARLLDGVPIIDAAQQRARLATVQCADVHQVVKEAIGTGLLQVPAGHSADWAGYAPAPASLYEIISGTACPSRGASQRSLVIGSTGVSLHVGEQSVTVPYERCAVKLSWPDGGRRLIGLDGSTVDVEPTLYDMDPALVTMIDSHVHPANTVWLPARDPQVIPRPKPAPVQAQAVPKAATKRMYDVPVMLAFGVAAVLWGLICLAATLDPSGIGPVGETIFTLVLFWGFEVLLIWPLVKIWRRRSR